ncbi:MAG: DUF5916 domain-containing protein [Rhodothermaceae bacterium]
MNFKTATFILCFFMIFTNAKNKSSSDKNIRAIKIKEPVLIDGIMEPIWNQSGVYSNFRQLDPFPFEKPAKPTEFRVLYDEKNLFVYIKAFDDPEKITTINGKRDINQFLTDWLKIMIDPLDSKTSAYTFMVNPSNVQNDSRLYNGGINRDPKWDGIWESATQVTKEGWTAEIKIPFNILKFQDKEVQDWGINIARYIFREQQQSNFILKDANAGHLITNYARLTNLSNLKAGNNFVFTPSVTTTFDSDQNYDPVKYKRTFGGDFRYNLNSKNTLMVTLVPDFAQIEADPDIINVSDYPVFLREKRPFFLEGNELFYTFDQLYYSRKMARPQIGTKFIGSGNNFEYGLMYIRNEGINDTINHFEDFTITRLKYGNEKIKLGYLGGYVDSKYNLSGQLHSFDFRYQITNSLEIRTLAATTLIDENKIGNSSLRFRASYLTEKWRLYIALQKKTPHFEQGLIGYPEANNITEMIFHYQRRIKLKKGFLSRARYNFGLSSNSLYNNDLNFSRYFFNIHFTFNSPAFGIIYAGTAFERILGYGRYYTSDGTYLDNYGSFAPISHNHFRYRGYLETDPSKVFKIFIRYAKTSIKQAETNRYDFHLTYKASEFFNSTLSYTLYDIGYSKYLSEDDRGKLSTVSLRTEYSITENIFLKLYNQYNSQYDRLSNNLVVSYEYLRGNFIYLAYADTGFFDDSKLTDSYLAKYKIDRRTISLKWSYALYL